MPGWRNWQTRRSQKPVEITLRVGSTPTLGTRSSMKYTVKPTDILKFDGDTLLVSAFLDKAGERMLSKEAALLDRTAAGALTLLLADEDFKPAVGSTFVWYLQDMPFRRVILVGFGRKEKLTSVALQTAVAAGIRRAGMIGGKRVGFAVPEEIALAFESQKAGQGIVVGAALGSYIFIRHKSEGDKELKKQLDELVLLTSAGRLSAMALGVRTGELIANAVRLARDLVNEPPSVTTPTHLADVARSFVKKGSPVTCEVFGKAEIAKMGMGGLMGIAQGSDEEPKFIRLNYKGGGRKTIVLAGKGITFDTGGLSLKPAEHMETMKLDMAAAATVLAVFSVLPALAPKINVVGLIAATENMLGPKAVKPGDVVKIMNGKTVEILNTDAEGRMVLADALSYASKHLKPDGIIDLATLTGACMVALGQDIAGVFSNNTALGAAVLKAAKDAGELVWEMPLAPEYKELLKSPVADLKNIGGGRYGGAITAALFLEEFVGKDIPWVHLDIAGPAFAEKDTPLMPRGGTGFGVRMLLEFLQNAA